MARISDAVDIAIEAAEKIRVLNLVTHPSSGWSGLDDPVDVYEVLGALAALADRLQQNTNQLGRYLDGASITALPEHFKIHRTTVSLHLLRQGVRDRRRT
jgi:hypothetical protein